MISGMPFGHSTRNWYGPPDPHDPPTAMTDRIDLYSRVNAATMQPTLTTSTRCHTAAPIGEPRPSVSIGTQ